MDELVTLAHSPPFFFSSKMFVPVSCIFFLVVFVHRVLSFFICEVVNISFSVSRERISTADKIMIKVGGNPTGVVLNLVVRSCRRDRFYC